MKRFAVTLFVSATLLFACQPMVARMIVPLLGGAPAVWILCSLCFQALVLGGYAYAHVVGSRLSLGTQVALQLALVIAAFFVLPVVVDEALLASLTARSTSLGLLAVLLRAVGLPFFVLATTSPLLQRWYAELGEPDPYHLYAASNAGSMVALLGYPFLVEPFVALREQSRYLGFGFAFYTLLVTLCAVTALRKRRPHVAALSDEPPSSSPPRPPWRDRAGWLALAFVPSSLLMGATAFITTDLASVPLLWVLPLTLYLASFIVAFAKKQPIGQDLVSKVLAGLAVILALSMVAQMRGPAGPVVGLHLLFLFVASVVCHRALAVRRPSHHRLTEFYLVMSLGGVLGGAFNGLVAPVVFDDLLEYPIAIGLALLARLAVDKTTKARWRRDVLCGIGVVFVSLLLVKVQDHVPAKPLYAIVWVYALPLLFVYRWTNRPIRYAVAVGGLLVVSITHGALSGRAIFKERDFYGVLMLKRDETNQYLLLVSGSTVHGAQATAAEQKHVPLTYFSPRGPVGDVLGPLPDRASKEVSSRRVGVIGLGVGSLAAYARSGETWTFFELNPKDVDLAQHWFSYLSDVPSGARVTTEIGDARLRLRDGAAQRFDMLVLDAFSSDAIPIHLLTREALVVYRRALAPGGLLLMHISNRHILLEPVVAALAADAKLFGVGRDQRETGAQVAHLASHWLCLSESQEALASIAARNADWHELVTQPRQPVWSDDFANVLAAMHF